MDDSFRPIKVFKTKYSSQDVRKQALEARDELLANVEFLMDCIREDRLKMQNYKKRFGDLKYRPVIRPANDSIGPEYGSPTELNLEPLAATYRATINSLLQSIRLIQSEILPEENPEGENSNPSGEAKDVSNKRSSLRSQFSSEAENQAGPIQPDELDSNEAAQNTPTKPQTRIPATKLVENPRIPTNHPNRAYAELPTQAEPKSMPHRPWRDKPQSKFVPTEPNSVVQDETLKASQAKKIELTSTEPMDAESERIRADLFSLKGSTNRMASIRDKYRIEENEELDSDENGEDEE